MYAIVEIAGKQFKVGENDKVIVPLLEQEIGKKVSFDNVLLLADEKDIKVGSPFLKGSKIEATVLDHFQDKKVVVFKKKRRKGYRVTKGHRQWYSQLQVNKIS